ncbi:MAG: PEP-CTERM sorting domain-containing protein [Rhizobiaceae bacterium]
MLYLFKSAKYVFCACAVLLFLSGATQASVITLAKTNNPANELAASKIALHDFVFNGGVVNFDIDSLVYLGKLDTSLQMSNGQYAANGENPATPNSTFRLSNVSLDGDGELLTASVGFSPELMLALLVVDGNVPTNLYFNNMFSNVTVGDNKAISHFTAFGVLPTAVPVPAALPLFGTGIALLGLLGWRRKRRAS